MRRTVFVLIVALAAPACEQRRKPPPVEDTPGVAVTLVGIDPERWTCDVVATRAMVSEAVAGPVREIDSTMPSPRGTPRPCNYLLEVGGGAIAVAADGGSAPEPRVEAWTFDLDCRPGALRTADTLWKEYTAYNEGLLAAYGDARAEELRDDAGVTHGPPGPATPVAVGARGLDHNGQALLFVDDDTPCYGRVVGPDAARRLALAQLIAKHLRPATAPMDPRPATPPVERPAGK